MRTDEQDNNTINNNINTTANTIGNVLNPAQEKAAGFFQGAALILAGPGRRGTAAEGAAYWPPQRESVPAGRRPPPG